MKKIFYLVFFIGIFSAAQQATDNGFSNSENRFSKSENERAAKAAKPNSGIVNKGPGNPGEPVPIDKHIPLLLLSGIVLAAVLTFKQRKVQN